MRMSGNYELFVVLAPDNVPTVGKIIDSHKPIITVIRRELFRLSA